MGATEFARVLVQHRHAAGLAQEQLADRAGLSVRGVRYLERGDRAPYPDTVNRIAAALSLSEEARRAMTDAAAAARGRMPGGVLPEPLPNPDDVVGRSADIDAVAAMLRGGARIVTVTGPGGVGKTTLAAAAARQLDHEYTGGVRWASLATVSEPGAASGLIARAMDVPASPRDLASAITAQLAGASSLVVLDNMEHITAAGPILSDLVERCLGLQFLVTSRTALRVRPEQEYRLAPLAVPGPGTPVDLAGVLRSPAVQLFQLRARGIDYLFAVGEQNAAAVTAICQRLDGLPLAIELAAARVRILDPAEIVRHLDHPLDLLTDGPQDAPARQRSLRGVIAWSYGLLTPSQQHLFRRLSTFVGGADLDAITRVCGEEGGPAIVDDLDTLVRSSLVTRDVVGGRSRFRLLETICAYAAERLAGQPTELERARTRHATHFAQLANDTGPQVEGPRQAEAMARLDPDWHNIQAALTHLGAVGRAADGLRAASAAWMYAYVRGRAGELRSHLTALLDIPGHGVPAELRAAGLLALSQLARAQDDLSTAAAIAEEAVALCRTSADSPGLATALFGAGFIARMQRAPDQARHLLADALTTARSVGSAYIEAAALHHLAMLELDTSGDRSTARQFLHESLSKYREMGYPRMIGIVLATLGNLENLDGCATPAERHYLESLRILIDAGEPREIHFPLEGLADLAYAAGDVERAISLASAAATYRYALRGRPVGPALTGACAWLDDARRSLSAERFAAAWDKGEALSPYDSAAEATQPLTRGASVSPAPT